MKKAYLFILIINSLCFSAFGAQQKQESVNTQNVRQVISLNDNWLFKKNNVDSLNHWDEVNIPHTWNNVDMQTRRNNFYAGQAVYKKIFIPSNSLKNKRVFIHFEGVGANAVVYLNNTFIGNHNGAYAAFTLEMTKNLKFGENNELKVLVDNSANPSVIPVNHVLFGVYGGIYRPVNIIATDNINIAVTDYASSGVYITQRKISDKAAEIRLNVKIDNNTGKQNQIILKTTILEKNGKVKAVQTTPLTLPIQGRSFVSQDIKIGKPHLWQGLEDPYLYKTIIQLIKNNEIIDEVVQPLGIRHIELKEGVGMFLNGKKIPMYGVCRHQDWWELGSALTNKNHDKDLEIIKEIGATTIRLAHYQQSEYFYSKCDSIGFLVWAEIPFVNKVTTQESANAKQQLTELIRQNYNHPSIFVWGLHNEVYKPSDYVISLTRELNDLAKTEDPSRFTVQVNGYNKINHEVNNIADIQGINQYFGWYNGTLDSVKTWVERIETQFPKHKVFFSEYGAEANIYQQKENVSNRGDCCGFDKDYNEAFSTRFHEEHWNIISKHPYILASYVWNTFDFATPMSSQGGIEARNMKGLVTFDREIKKDPFYWYKANWSKEPVLYITQRRVVNRGNKITPVTVYSNVGLPTLWVNRKQITNYKKGYTDVHYIFPDVELKTGENIVKVEVTYKGKILEDEIRWNYSEDFDLDESTPDVLTDEHVGL